jgi:LAO/AO transport system kinase
MMLDLSGHNDWRPKIIQTVATRGEGIDELWDAIREHREFQMADGRLDRRRAARLRDELLSIVTSRLAEQAAAACSGDHFEELLGAVTRRELDPHAAVAQLLDAS